MSGRVYAIAGAVVAALVIGGGATYFVMKPSADPQATVEQQPVADQQLAGSTTSAVSSPAVFDMRGAVTLLVPNGSTGMVDGSPCKGSGTESDLQRSTPVKVFDDTGKLLTTGALQRGKYVTGPTEACTFQFTVSGVPDGLPSYGVEVGSHGVQKVSSVDAHAWVNFHNL